MKDLFGRARRQGEDGALDPAFRRKMAPAGLAAAALALVQPAFDVAADASVPLLGAPPELR